MNPKFAKFLEKMHNHQGNGALFKKHAFSRFHEGNGTFLCQKVSKSWVMTRINRRFWTFLKNVSFPVEKRSKLRLPAAFPVRFAMCMRIRIRMHIANLNGNAAREA